METVDPHTNRGEKPDDQPRQATRLLEAAFALRKLRRWNGNLQRAAQRLAEKPPDDRTVRRERLILAHRYQRALGIDSSQQENLEEALIEAVRTGNRAVADIVAELHQDQASNGSSAGEGSAV